MHAEYYISLQVLYIYSNICCGHLYLISPSLSTYVLLVPIGVLLWQITNVLFPEAFIDMFLSSHKLILILKSIFSVHKNPLCSFPQKNLYQCSLSQTWWSHVLITKMFPKLPLEAFF